MYGPQSQNFLEWFKSKVFHDKLRRSIQILTLLEKITQNFYFFTVRPWMLGNQHKIYEDIFFLNYQKYFKLKWNFKRVKKNFFFIRHWFNLRFNLTRLVFNELKKIVWVLVVWNFYHFKSIFHQNLNFYMLFFNF